ncbi:MAG: hypothetical protein K9J13_08005 [Saprospiraceae bacterium]|nr:hypothetical protein [Saprospiraceae bacterium]
MDLIKDKSIERLLSIKDKAKEYFGVKEKLKRDKSNLSIAGNTFRAYRDYKIPPSKVFKNWIIQNKIIESFSSSSLTIKSYNDFLQHHNWLSIDLEKYWHTIQSKNLTISQKFKIIDLLIKTLSKLSFNKSLEINYKLCQYGHIPLDKFALLAVKENFSGIVISKNPSMGDIEDNNTYYFIQNQIRILTEKANVPNLYFDYYAWNRVH